MKVGSNIYDIVEASDYWDRVFAKPDPWEYSSAYENTKFYHTLSLIEPGEFNRALEVACAEGHFTNLLADRVSELVASDISKVALDRAARRCATKGNIDFRVLDVVRDAIPGEFDLIICSEMLYYLGTIERLETIIRKFACALAAGGAIVLTHPNIVADDPDETGFDWDRHTFGAKTIGEVVLHVGGLVIDREFRTPLYRVQRVRKASKHICSFPAFITEQRETEPLDRKVERGVVRGGAIMAREVAMRRERTTSIPILMYHRVAVDGPDELSAYRVRPEQFLNQIRWLRRHGYYSVSVEQWRNAIQSKSSLAGRPILITFDDGYRDFAQVAWPILDRHGFSAVVFVVAGKVDTISDWDAAYGDPAPLLSWSELQELACAEVEFGSHSMNHRQLNTLSPEELFQECANSRALLEDRLRCSVVSFSYPWGVHNGVVRRLLIECGYRMAFTTRPAFSRITDDLLVLPRLEVLSNRTIRDFELMLDPAAP